MKDRGLTTILTDLQKQITRFKIQESDPSAVSEKPRAPRGFKIHYSRFKMATGTPQAKNPQSRFPSTEYRVPDFGVNPCHPRLQRLSFRIVARGHFTTASPLLLSSRRLLGARCS